jgi:hypothetical protein
LLLCATAWHYQAQKEAKNYRGKAESFADCYYQKCRVESPCVTPQQHQLIEQQCQEKLEQ